jgi:glycerol kinase
MKNVMGVGITNQRETTIIWDRQTGEPIYNAIVWQDRRTASLCKDLQDVGAESLIRERTGLVIDPYFSGTKIAWLLDHVNGARGRAERGELAFGTIDSWLTWQLTGNRTHVTDVSNASRTLLFNIHTNDWDDELLRLLRVPPAILPEVHPSAHAFGMVPAALFGEPLIIGGIAGDQQAALFGQACLEPGMTKNTYGTGSFVLMNIGTERPAPTEGMLTTVAWTLADGTTHYALEGAIFVTGAAVQWLRDELGIVRTAAEIGPLAESVPDTGGAYLVPAFAGLGSPWWDPYARGTIVGITRGTGRAQLARAVVEAMAYQTRDVVEAMAAASGRAISELRIDGGASVMDLLAQLQADQLGVDVSRPANPETTALGAAYLAGLAEGVWPSVGDLAASWRLERTFEPAPDRTAADAAYAEWRRAVDRSRAWAPST